MDLLKLFKTRKSAAPSLTASPGERMVAFNDLGMHCASCQRSIEGQLRAVGGVRQIDVKLSGQSATVIFDPNETTIEALQSAIEEAGYTPLSHTVLAG